MDISWRDLFTISLIVLIIGALTASYGVVARSEGLIIASSILILFPIPFVMLSYRALKGEEVRSKDLYNNAIVGLVMITIVSLSGYFLFATTQGKAVSLAVFLGTILSLIIEYISKKRAEAKSMRRTEIKTVESIEEPVKATVSETIEQKRVEKS